MTLPPSQALAEALRSEIENWRQLRQEVADDQRRFGEQTSPTVHDLRGIASVLSDIYEGAEKAFERIARAMSEPLPSGFGWHQKLLVQMGAPVIGKRPAVIQSQTQRQLDDFRLLKLLIADLETFCVFLEQLNEDRA
jgi:hypothetical protein